MSARIEIWRCEQGTGRLTRERRYCARIRVAGGYGAYLGSFTERRLVDERASWWSEQLGGIPIDDLTGIEELEGE